MAFVALIVALLALAPPVPAQEDKSLTEVTLEGFERIIRNEKARFSNDCRSDGALHFTVSLLIRRYRHGDVIAAVKELGAEVISPGFAVPYESKAGEDDYNPTATREYINKAHEAGIRVVPWTVNDAETMEEQLDAGVDGIITDYPTRLKEILDEREIEYGRMK
nr:glycerophosphoryl diester phosphodiesterase [Streptococcus thermophilus]